MYALIIFTVAIFSLAEPNGEIPPYVKTCPNNAELATCWKSTIENLRLRIAEGIPDFGVPPLDPLVVQKSVELNYEDYHPIITNVVVRDAKNFEIVNNEINLEQNIIELSVRFPVIIFDVEKAIAKGKLFNYTLNHEAKGRLQLENVLYRVKFTGTKESREGTSFIKFNVFETDANFDKSEAYATQLFENADETNDLNRQLEENIDLLHDFFKMFFLKTLGHTINDSVIRVYNNFPLKVLHPNV